MEFKGQVGQDKWVCEFFNYKRDGFFLDIGAYDGVFLSNTFVLEKELGWNGICVEPASGIYDVLITNRNVKCVNKAIFDENKLVEFGEIGFIGGIMKGGKQLVEAITMKTLLENNKTPKLIDYISLDIEGAEYNALTEFPFDEYDVILWTIEHNSYLDGGVLRDKTRELMTANGYVLHTADVKCDGLEFEDWYVNAKYVEL